MSEIYRTAVDPAATNNPHAYALAMVGRGKHVLEVGCSVGHVTERLVEAGDTVTGVELDPVAAAQALRFAERVHIVDLDVTPLGAVEDGMFDVLLLGDVLEHFRDPVAVLGELLRRLEKGGTVVISVPHVAHIDVRLMLLEGTWAYQPDGLLDRTHMRWFTRDGLRELLAACGLVATRVDRVRVGLGGSNLPIHPEAHGSEVLDFIRSDPEWQTYQFVLSAERSAGQNDALAGETVAWPAPAADLGAEVAGLREQNAALQAEVDAWRNAKIVRLSAPLRRLYGALRRRRR